MMVLAAKTMNTVLEEMIKCVFDWYNNIMSLVLDLISSNPQNFKGGNLWSVVVSINPIFVSVGCSLVVVFFIAGFCMESVDVKEEIRLESIIRLFIRLSIAECLVLNSLTIVKAFMSSITALAGLIKSNATDFEKISLSKDIKEAIEGLNSFQAIIFCLLFFIIAIGILGGAFLILYHVYFRFFKLMIGVPFGALAYSTVAGNHTVSHTSTAFTKYIIGTLLEAVAIILAIILCNSVIQSSDTIFNAVSDSKEGFYYVFSYMIETLFTVMLTAGSVQGASSLVQKALAL